MSYRYRSIGLASLALAVVLIPAPVSPSLAGGASKNQGPTVASTPGEARVRLNGRTVAALRTTNRGMAPPDRAALAVRRLRFFLSQGGRSTAIHTRALQDGAGVYAGDHLVMLATVAEAEAQGRTPLGLAETWARSLRTELAKSPRERRILRYAVNRGLWGVQALRRSGLQGDPLPSDPSARAPERLNAERLNAPESADCPSLEPVEQDVPEPPCTRGQGTGVEATERRSNRSLPPTPNTQHPTPAPGRTNVNFVRTDIADIVNTLSIQQSVNIALTPNAKGVVSVSLRNVTVEEAVRLISRLAGLDYVRSAGTYVIGTPAELLQMAARTGVSRVQPLRYLAAQDARDLLTASHPYVTARPTPGGNGVQLIGLPDDVTAACRALQEADVANSAAPLPVDTLTPQHIGRDELRDLLTRVLPALRVVEQGPALILCGTASGIEQARKVVAAVDVPVAERKTTFVYDLKFVSADEAKDALKVVLPDLLVSPAPEPYAPPAAQFNPLSTVAPSVIGAGAGGAGSGGAYGGGPGTGTNGNQAGAPRGFQSRFSRASAIILVGTDGDIAQARAILERTDVAPSQVLIEARVLELSPEATEALGISYGNPLTQLTITENPPDRGAFRFGSFRHSALNFNMTLNALITKQLARLLASPSIAVVNNEDANIFIGDLVKFISSQTTDLQGRLQFTIDTQPVGITLLVRPRVNAGGEITMKLHPVVSTLIRGVSLPGGANLPQVRSREADTTVRLKDGEMLAIGGLISEEDVRAMDRVPLLSDLPLIGELFKNRTKRRTRTELTVVITPRIVRPGESIPQPVFAGTPALPESKSSGK